MTTILKYIYIYIYIYIPFLENEVHPYHFRAAFSYLEDGKSIGLLKTGANYNEFLSELTGKCICLILPVLSLDFLWHFV